MKTVLRSVAYLLFSLLAVTVSVSAAPFLMEVKCTANPDGTVAISAKGTGDWRGTVTVRDEKGRLVAIVSKEEEKTYEAGKHVEFLWDGKDYSGNPAGGGKFTVRVEGLAAEPIGVYPGYYPSCESSVRFDSLERSVYVIGWTYWEEPPWTMDTASEVYCRRMSFDGLPMGPEIPFDNAHWNFVAPTVDIHDNIYAPGSSHEAALPYRLMKVNGRTGSVVWDRLSLPPKDAENPRAWYPGMPTFDHSWPKGVVYTSGFTGMWDTDSSFYCGCARVPYFFHIACKTGDFLRPPILSPVGNAWHEKMNLKRNQHAGRTFPDNSLLSRYYLDVLAVAPNGDIFGCPKDFGDQPAQSVARMRPDSSVIWVISQGVENKAPCSPEFIGSYYGTTTFTIASVVCDVADCLYNARGILTKFDRFGQLLLAARLAEKYIIDILDVSADGHMVVATAVHKWDARTHELDWAETALELKGKPLEGKPAVADIKPPTFLSSQETPADWLNLGRWYLAQKQYEKAVQALEQTIQKTKDEDYRAVAIVNIARAYERQGQLEKELAAYQRLGQVVPREAGWAALQIAQREKSHGRDESALRRLLQSSAAENDSYLRTRMLLQAAEWQPADEAIKTYREVAEKYFFVRKHALKGILKCAKEQKLSEVAETAEEELTVNYPTPQHGVWVRAWGKETGPQPGPEAEEKPGLAGDTIADFALGQDTLTASKYTLTFIPDAKRVIVPSHMRYYMNDPNTFAWQRGLEILDGRLWVADAHKGRIVCFDLPIARNRQDEAMFIGGPDLRKHQGPREWEWTWPDNHLGDSAKGLRIPWGLATDRKRLYVSDHAYHRVLVLDPQSPGENADVVCVLGQTKEDGIGFNGKSVFEGDMYEPTAWSLLLPCGVSCDGERLVVADSGNNRVLIWNTLPLKTGQPADIVLGQKDFTSRVRNRSGAASMNLPRGVFTDGKSLFVADTMNHRMLVWKTFPTRNAQPADIVLGVPGFETEGNWPIAADGRIGPDSMSFPQDVYYDGKSLYVCDGGNNRVLIWDGLPARNGQPCNRELGVPDPRTKRKGAGQWRLNMVGGGYCGDSILQFPSSVRADDKAVYVSDTWDNRVVVFLR